jgi:ubiquinone/menaquinone biosynthesis C-methylase UbiE
MSAPNNNLALFDDVEFYTWIEATELLPEEIFIIDRYLDRHLSTVEAGTNSGRILFEMQKMGFTSLSGFEYVPRLIDVAIARDPNRSIKFEVGDATDLTYADNSFDQIIYMQQLLCTIDEADDRLKAVREAYRILKPGGTGIFSVLSFEERSGKPLYSAFFKYLSTLRKLRGTERSLQYQPWLKLGGKFNFGALSDRAPYIYWYKSAEICELLAANGFKIAAVASGLQLTQGILKASERELTATDFDRALYIVVKK